MMFLKNFGINNRVNITMRTNNEKCCEELTSKTIDNSTFDNLKTIIDNHLNSIKNINDKCNFLEEAFSAVDVVAPFGKQPDNIKLTLKYIKSLIAKSANKSSEYFNKQNRIFKKINQQKDINKLAISITNDEKDITIAKEIEKLANFIKNYTVNSRQNQLMVQEHKMGSNIETIYNNGDAGLGYINSCGAIAVYDVFEQNGNAHIISNCNLNRNEFARDFKDDAYRNAKNIIEFCDSIERLDKNIKNEVQIRPFIQYKSVLKKNDHSKKLILAEIKPLIEKDIEYDTEVNKANCDYYGKNKIFDSLQDLLKDIYGGYFVDYIKKCLQSKRDSKKQHIKDIDKKLKNINIKIETYNNDLISRYEAKQSLGEFTQLIKKLSNSSSFPELQFEEWYLVYKSLDCCFSPPDIYDITTMYNEEEIIRKKNLFDTSYKNQQLSIAQIGIGLAKYGYIFDNIVKTTKNFQEIEIVSYKHVLNASILEIVHFPGHWEALKIPKIS